MKLTILISVCLIYIPFDVSSVNIVEHQHKSGFSALETLVSHPQFITLCGSNSIYLYTSDSALLSQTSPFKENSMLILRNINQRTPANCPAMTIDLQDECNGCSLTCGDTSINFAIRFKNLSFAEEGYINATLIKKSDHWVLSKFSVLRPYSDLDTSLILNDKLISNLMLQIVKKPEFLQQFRDESPVFVHNELLPISFIQMAKGINFVLPENLGSLSYAKLLRMVKKSINPPFESYAIAIVLEFPNNATTICFDFTGNQLQYAGYLYQVSIPNPELTDFQK